MKFALALLICICLSPKFNGFHIGEDVKGQLSQFDPIIESSKVKKVAARNREVQDYYHSKPNIGITIYVVELADDTSPENVKLALEIVKLMSWLSQKSIILVKLHRYHYELRSEELDKLSINSLIDSLINRDFKSNTKQDSQVKQGSQSQNNVIVTTQLLTSISEPQDIVIHYLTNLNVLERNRIGLKLIDSAVSKRAKLRVVGFRYLVGKDSSGRQDGLGYRGNFKYLKMQDFYDQAKYIRDMHEKIGTDHKKGN